MANRTIRTSKKRAKFLKALSEGASVGGACRSAQIGRTAAYQWRSEDDVFAKEWDDAVADGTNVLEDEALRRAHKGTLEPVVSAGKLVTRVRKYSDTLLIFLLKARDPKYKEKSAVELTGADGGPMQHEHSVEHMTNEQIDAQLREILGPVIAAGKPKAGTESAG